MNDTDTSHSPPQNGPTRCQRAREALSAALDREQQPPLTPELAEHLSTCKACQQWQEALHQLTRRVRLSAARTIPDQTPQLLSAVLADQQPPENCRPARRFARWGLTAVAVGQLVIIIPALVLGQAGPLVPPHASRELGAFNLALSVGFLAAALRPTRARGMLAVIGAATTALIVLAGIDTALGQTTLLAETPHLITLAGWMTLYLLARTDRHPPRRPHPTRHHPHTQNSLRRRLFATTPDA